MAMQLFTAQEYLKIDVANAYGLDKDDWNDRLRWFNKNEPKLLEMIHEAEEPALFYAAAKAWEDVKLGNPTGHMISLDATSSGLQILAALVGDRKAARLCNVIDAGSRKDAYKVIYDEMLGEIGEDARIKRGDCKDAIMTSLYGSTAMPKQVFGEGILLSLFFHTMEKEAPGAWELNQAFLSMWNPNAYSHDWTLPDNFHVHVKVMDMVRNRVHFLNKPYDVFIKENQPTQEGRSLGANTIHSLDGMIVREMSRRCDYDLKTVMQLRLMLADPEVVHGQSVVDENDDLVLTLWNHYQESGYLSARIIDHLEPKNFGHVDMADIIELLNSLPKKPFKVVAIHDCFRCHPNYGNDLRKQYNNQLKLIAKSNLLSFLVSQIIERKVQLHKMDARLWMDIEDTNYALS